MLKAFGALDADGQKVLADDIRSLIGAFNRATDGTVVIESEYLEIVVRRA